MDLVTAFLTNYFNETLLPILKTVYTDEEITQGVAFSTDHVLPDLAQSALSLINLLYPANSEAAG